MTEQFQIELLGDSAMMIRFGEEINEQVNGLVHAAAAYIEEQPFPGFIECIPAFTSLTVFYDMYEVYKHLPQGISSPFEKVKRDVEGRLKEIAIDYENNRRIVEIPVCYGGEFGPDLEEVAKINQLSTEEVIDIHTSGEYVVYMLGFAPGFPFLGGMSKRIAAPRKSSPRAVDSRRFSWNCGNANRCLSDFNAGRLAADRQNAIGSVPATGKPADVIEGGRYC